MKCFCRQVVLGIVAVVSLVIAGCGPSVSELPKVRIVINTWPGLGPYYVAHAKGFDKDEGVLIDVVMNEDTVGRNAALASGEADLIGITLDYVVIAQSQGLPLVVVGESDFSDGGDGIIATPDIQSVRDLKGKKVACAEGLPSHFFLIYQLKKNNLGPKDIEMVPAEDGGKAAFAFMARQADAAVTWDPWISQAEKQTEGRGHVITTTRDTPGLILGIVAADKDKLKSRVDRIVRAQRAWFKAVDYCKQHPQEANAIMAEKYNVPAADFARMIGGAKLADLEEVKRTFGTTDKPGPIYQLAKEADQLWREAGVTKKPIAPESVIDRSVVDKLFGEK